MSTEFFNDQWRIPSNENQNKVSNYSLQGTNNISISSPAPVGITSSFSFWFKRENTALNTQIYNVVGTGAYGFYIVGTSIIYIRYGAGYISVNNTETQNALALTDWVHWVITRQEVTSTTQDIRLYANGTLIYSLNGTSSLGTLDSKVNYLMWALNTSDFLDSFSIFNYALSQAQINTLSGSSSTGVGNPMSLSPNPAAYYQLGDQSVYNGANYLVPNNSLQDYVFAFAQPIQYSNPGTANTPIIAPNQGSVFSGISNFSFSGWFNIPLYTYFMAFYIGDSSNPYFNINMYGNDLRFNVTPGNSYIEDLQNIVPVNTWFHFAGVFDGSGASDTDRLKLYINGEAQTVLYSTTNPTSFPTIPSGTDINLGKTFSVLTQTTMLSSNIQLWDSSLIPSEVQTLYNNGSPIQTLSNVPQNPNLKLWWKLDSSEIYNSSTTEWGINQAQAYVQNSVFCPNVSGQTVTDYLQVSNYSGTTGKTAASWSFWYNASEANNQSGALSGGVAEFKRNAGGQYAGMEFTLYTEVAGVNVTFSTKGTRFGGRYMDMPAAGNDAGIQGIGDWVNIVLVYDGSDPAPDLVNGGFAPQSGSIRAYANGAQGFLLGTLNQYNGVYPAEGTIRTGSLIFGGGDFATRHMSASLSNYATWDKALTQAEVNEIVNNGQPKDLSTHSASSNLISWWRLNNLTTGLVDTIGSYNATIVGSNSVVKPGSISQLNGTSFGMSQASLVQSDLSFTNGYSPYALDFGGISSNLKTYTIPAATNTVTLSAWVKRTGASGDLAGVFGVRNSGVAPGYGICWDLCFLSTTNKIEFRVSETDGSAYIQSTSNVALTDNTWTHVVGVADGTNVKLYINGVLQTDIESYNGTLRAPTSNIFFAAQGPNGSNNLFNGQLSNCARWNIGLTQAEVTEIYNQGVPSNLNTFSGTAPIGWWQIGSNSSFEGVIWTCLDEIGTDYADSNSTTMSNDDIVNGPGYSASGLGASTIDIIGDAPYSTANGLSENMDVLDRTIDVPS